MRDFALRTTINISVFIFYYYFQLDDFKMGNGKALVLSHSLIFLTGFAFGKYVDHAELMTYRDAHASFADRWRRRAGNSALGVLALGTIGLFIRVSSRGSSTTTSSGM